jgi:hypothetical protein
MTARLSLRKKLNIPFKTDNVHVRQNRILRVSLSAITVTVSVVPCLPRPPLSHALVARGDVL